MDFTDLKNTWIHGQPVSQREHQILAMYSYGFNDDQIVAEHLGITVKYVQYAKSKLRRRFEVYSLHSLARVYESARQI